MLDQIFGRLFSSQWIVFAILLIVLVGLSELAWRIGLASSRKKSETDKERSANLQDRMWAEAVAACGWSVIPQEVPDATRFLSDSFFQFSSRSSLQ